MKKYLIILLSVLLAFAVVGCNKGIDNPEYTVGNDGEQIINEDTAMRAAANKAELGVADVKYTSVVYGTNKYDISFIHEGYEYSATVNAENGSVDDFDKVEITGIVSEDEALNAVLKAMLVTKEDLADLEIELDKEDGVYVYEIEFDYGDMEWEYNVDATTGEIIVELTNSEAIDSDDDDIDESDDDDDIDESDDDDEDDIDESDDDDDIDEDDDDIDESDDDDDDDIDESDDDDEDDIDESDDDDDIDESNDDDDKDIDESDDDDDEEVKVPSEETSGDLISEKDAYHIALQHAGVDENTVENLHIDLEEKRGGFQYEIEFVSGYTEYDFDIDAVSGAIINFDKDAESCDAPDYSQPGEEEYIGEDAALNAAYAHAGVNAEDVSDLEIELDEGKGVFKYEIEFKCGETEYEYDINALDGSVMQFNQEIDD